MRKYCVKQRSEKFKGRKTEWGEKSLAVQEKPDEGGRASSAPKNLFSYDMPQPTRNVIGMLSEVETLWRYPVTIASARPGTRLALSTRMM